MLSRIAVVAAVTVAWLALPGALLAATTADPPQDACWTRVVNDWAKDGRVAATYRIRCYTEAIEKAPTDVLTHGTFKQDVLKARKTAIRTCVVRLGNVPDCGPDGNARTSPDYQCWVKVVNDWARNTRIRPVHKVHCYSDALRLLPADLRTYTTIVPEIKRARAKAIARCERVRGAGVEACQA